METVNRRSAMKAAVVGTAVLTGAAQGAEPRAAKLWTLEGELKVHPKYLYRYYLVFGDGKRCGLFGPNHDREPELLARVKLPARVRVRGELGTEHHAGGTRENPSPFPPAWMVFMDVHEVETLK